MNGSNIAECGRIHGVFRASCFRGLDSPQLWWWLHVSGTILNRSTFPRRIQLNIISTEIARSGPVSTRLSLQRRRINRKRNNHSSCLAVWRRSPKSTIQVVVMPPKRGPFGNLLEYTSTCAIWDPNSFFEPPEVSGSSNVVNDCFYFLNNSPICRPWVIFY